MASHGGLDDGVVELQAIEQPSVWPSPRTRRRRLRASPACREQLLRSADRKGDPGSPRHLDRRAPIDAVHVVPPTAVVPQFYTKLLRCVSGVRGPIADPPLPGRRGWFWGAGAT